MSATHANTKGTHLIPNALMLKYDLLNKIQIKYVEWKVRLYMISNIIQTTHISIVWY